MKFNITYDNHDISIVADYRKGNDALILLIHGIGCTKESFQDIWDREEYKKFSILAPDLVGFGDSSKSEDFSYKMEDHAGVLTELLQQIEFKELHIVAHSMGGAVGVLLAEKCGIKSFVNIEGNLIAEDCGLITRKVVERPYEEFRDGFFDEIREIIGNVNEPGAKLWVDWTKKSDPLAFYKSAESLVLWSDSGELIKRFLALPAKKVYVYGEYNKDMPIVTRLEDVTKIEIAGSGHFVMNDNPEAFYSFLFSIVTS